MTHRKTSETLALLAKIATASKSDVVELAKKKHLPNLPGGGKDFNPLDHPRNPANGEFVKKGTGTFLFGMAKKALFKTSGGGSIDIDLKPGDKQYRSTKTKSTYVKHANGSITAYTASGEKHEYGLDKVGPQQKFDQMVESGSFQKINEARGVEVPADSLEQAQKAHTQKVSVGDLVNKAQMVWLPEGSTLADSAGYSLTKDSKGEWVGSDGENFGIWTTGEPLTVQKIGASDSKVTEDSDAPWDAPETEKKPDAPKIIHAKILSKDGKKVDDSESDAPWDATDGEDTVGDAEEALPDKDPKTPETKAGTKKVEPVAVEGKKNKLTAYNEADAPDGMGPVQSFNNKSYTITDLLSQKDGFTHPISGDSFPLEAGDVVLQHKLTPSSFAILDAEGNKKFQINKLGKKYKWSPHIPKSNYKIIHSVANNSDTFDPQDETLPNASEFIKGKTFTHPVSGLSVEIGKGEKLMQHNFTPHSYVVMDDDGKMLYKIDVKGKKQKAGTNLKASNYFEAFDGTKASQKKAKDHTEALESVPSLTLLNNALSAMDEGDTFKIGSYSWTKIGEVEGVPDFTTDDPDFPMYGTTVAKLKHLRHAATKGKKNKNGVPYNTIDLGGHLSTLPVGSEISGISTVDGSSLVVGRKTNSGWEYSYDPPMGNIMFAQTFLANVDFDSMSIKEPKKDVKNKNGVPIMGTSDEFEAYLKDLPAGAKFEVGPTFSIVKQDDGSWETPTGKTFESFAVSKLPLKWGEYSKNEAKVTLPQQSSAAEKTPGNTITPKDKDSAKAWLDKLSVGTKIGFPEGSKYSLSSGGSKYLTKVGPSKYQMEYAESKITGATVAKHFSSINAPMLSEVTVLETPDTPLGNLTKKTSKGQTKKVPAPSVPDVTPTKTFNTPAEFDTYTQSKFKYSYYSGTPDVSGSLFKELADLTGLKEHHVYGGYQMTAFSTLPQLSNPELGSKLDEMIVNLETAKKDKSLGLSSSKKASTTKMLTKLKTLREWNTQAQQLQAGELPDSPPTQIKWGMKSTWSFDMDSAFLQLTMKYNQVKFTKDSEALGWDPFSGTTEQYTDWLLEADHPWAVYLPDEHLKSVSLHYMKAPGYNLPPYKLNSFQSAAKTQHFAAKVDEAVAKKNGQPFTMALAKDHKFPDAPSDVSPSYWKSLEYVLSEDFSGKDSADYKDAEASVPQFKKSLGPVGDNIPDAAATAILYVKAQAPNDSSYVNNAQAKKAASHLLKSGIWFDNALTYESPKGKFPLSPGMEVWEDSQGRLWFVPKDHQTGVVSYFDTDGLFENGSFSSAHKTKVYTAPYTLKHHDSVKDGMEFSIGDWGKVEAIEGTIPPKTDFSGSDAVKIKDALGDHPVKVSELSDKAKTLILQHPEYAEIITYKDQKGHYNVVVPSSTKEKTWKSYVESNSNLPDFLSGLGDGKSVPDGDAVMKAVTDAPLQTKKDALASFGSAITLDPSTFTAEWEYNAALWSHLHSVVLPQVKADFNEPATPAPKTPPPPVGVTGSLKPIPNLGLGGGQAKKYFADADGNKFMGKPVPNNRKFRSDSEHAANEIGRMFGFNTAPTTVREVNGEYMVVQQLKPASGDLSGVSYKSLESPDLITAMQGHVLDWAISNHDTHGGNYLRETDGSILKIDLGQAWKGLGSDKLAVGYKMPGNFGDIWYDQFYRDVQTKKVPKEQLDTVAGAVLKKARQISTKRDEDFRTQIDFALKTRTSFPGSHDRESFAELAMKRKEETFDDFFKFYEKLYKDGGYDFGFTKESFENKTLGDSDTHLSVSGDLVEQVTAGGGYGKSLMVDSVDIEDSHILMYATKSKDGSTNFRGDLKVRRDGDKKIVAWLQEHGASVSTPTSAENQNIPQNSLPGTQDAWSSLVELAKTVSVHSPQGGKNPDGQYNQQTVDKAKAQKLGLQGLVTGFKGAIAEDPMFVGKHGVPSFQTAHQQQAWIEWAEDLIPKFDATLDAMSKGQKSPKWELQQPLYVAPKGIDVSGKPSPIEELTGPNGQKFTKYSDWNFVGPDGQITQAEYEALQTGPGWNTKSLKTPDTPEQDSKQVSAQKTFNITKTKFSTYTVAANSKDENGTVVETGPQTGANFQSVAFEISSPSHPGLSIQYVPHGTAAEKTNLGRLQFKIEKFDGSDAQVEAAIGLVREMGVDVEEADEKSLELFYWRHLSNILQQRQGGQTPTNQKVLSAIQQGYKKPSLSQQEELDMLKKAFSISFGEDRVKKTDWRPRFDSGRRGTPGFEEGQTDGRPYWIRPDYDPAAYKEWSNGRLPGRDFWNTEKGDSFSSAIRPYDNSGGFLSGEERTRFTGNFAGGSGSSGSSTSASDRNVGGSQVIFTRAKHSLGENKQYFEPNVSGRTHTWSATSDAYGATASKNSTSPFDMKDLITRSSTEMNIKYGVSAWDNLAVTRVSPAVRKKMLDYFAKKGITAIRGIPVGERVVDNDADLKKTLDKVWAMAIEAEKERQAAWEKEQGL